MESENTSTKKTVNKKIEIPKYVLLTEVSHDLIKSKHFSSQNHLYFVGLPKVFCHNDYNKIMIDC